MGSFLGVYLGTNYKNISVPQFTHLQFEDNSNTYLKKVLEALKEIMHVQHSAWNTGSVGEKVNCGYMSSVRNSSPFPIQPTTLGQS